MRIASGIIYVGVNDHDIDLFEGQYVVPNGMAYNSYVILDGKVAVMDTVDGRFTQQWLANVAAALNGRQPDYLVVQHMEPDHSSSVAAFMAAYPQATVVSSKQAFPMMANFYGDDYADRRIIVGEGSTLELGIHTLSFITAPMVHWPEVIMTYDATDKLLFSADAFGKFGALDADEPWDDEARRYYIGIVGKFGTQVQAVLKKAAALDLEVICPLHGPVLTKDLGHYLDLYSTWSSYGVEEDGIVIAYTSVYGNTRAAVELLAQQLREAGSSCTVYDLCRCDMPAAVADAFRYGKVVLATTTYNGDIFPPMRTYLQHLAARNFRGRKVAIIDNGSWAPQATRVIKGILEGCKDLEFLPEVKIKSAMSSQNKQEISALASALLQ